MLPRRLFCQALAATGVLGTDMAAAQTPAKVYRMGHLELGRAGDPAPFVDSFRIELVRLGLVEGFNLATDFRTARGNPALLDALAAELVAARPDVLYSSSGIVTTRALQKATSTIPIVFEGVGEPVAAGLVASLARPGGNLTGGTLPDELELKRVQILLEVLGASAPVALLTTPVAERRMTRFRDALAATRLQLQIVEVRTPQDLAPAFEQMARQRVAGVAVAMSALTVTNEPEIAALALKHRLPAIGSGGTYIDQGMMLSYSVDMSELQRNAANYIHLILKGAQPGDLPIRQATKFDFVVNLKTARLLGVRVPASVMIAATRVID